MYTCALVCVQCRLRKLEIKPNVNPTVEVTLCTEGTVHYFLVCLSFFCSLFLMLQWIFTVVSFLASLSFYHLMVPRPGGCSFYFVSCMAPYLHFEKRKKTQNPEPRNRLTGTDVVVSHFQTAGQDSIIRFRLTEVIVPYHQSFLGLSIFFLSVPLSKTGG